MKVKGLLDGQEDIIDKLGVQVVEKAYQRLCSKCIGGGRYRCRANLLPLTSDGSDCPYFKKEDDTT